MAKTITWIGVLGLLLFTRNVLTAFSDKLNYRESISLLFQTVIVLVLSLYVLQDGSANDPESKDPSTGDTPDQAQSRIMAYIQSQSRVKKHVSLEENLSARWKMSKNVISKIEQFSDYILRDFVRFWYYSVTTDDCVLQDIEHCLGNAFGMLLMRGRLGLNPITFGFDKCFQSLVRMLSIHREGKDAATEMLSRSGASAPSAYEASRIFRRAVAEEVRQRKHLHPMFYLPVEWNEKVSGHFTGGDPSKLSEEDFFNSQRIKACEAKYFQYLAKHLTKILLVEKEDANCRVVRHLITELLSNCVLYPVFNLFTPLVVNQWVAYALTPVTTSDEIAASGMPRTQEASRTISSKDPVVMNDFAPPPGFAPDRCWAFFKSGVHERDIFKTLCRQCPGTYGLICLNDKDLFSLLCVYEDSAAGNGVYHVPFVGYTTDPTGFQICLLTSDEYFPFSRGPPPAIELLNGSLFVTLEQLVVALASIASCGFDFKNDVAISNDSVENSKAENRDVTKDIDDPNADEFTDNAEIPSNGREEIFDEDLDIRQECVLSHVETPVDDRELWIEQERLVMLYELQGSVEEFQDALQFCEAQRKSTKKNHEERQAINIDGDKTAIRALKRIILCLEDIIFHGFSANVEDIMYSAVESRTESTVYELNNSTVGDVERKPAMSVSDSTDFLAHQASSARKSVFSLKTMVKRAMTTKKSDVDVVVADGLEPPAHYRRLSLRTTAAIDGMLNLLDKRYAFNWFWLEILKNTSVLSGDRSDNGLVSSASAKLRRFSNSRREDPTPVVQRLYNSWMDLFSNHLLLSIDDCQQEVVTSDNAHRASSAVDRNCLRVFLYDSLVQGRLVERISRIVRIATKEISIDDEKREGGEYIIPSFYFPGAVRGQWSATAILSSPADIAKLLSSLASLRNTAVVLPSTNNNNDISEAPDENNGGAGLMSFINSASLLSAFSEITHRTGHDSESAQSTGVIKNNHRDERVAFARRFRSRRQSVDLAWGHRMSVEEPHSKNAQSDTVTSPNRRSTAFIGKSPFAKVGILLSKVSDAESETQKEKNWREGTFHVQDSVDDESEISANSQLPEVKATHVASNSLNVVHSTSSAPTIKNIRRQELQFKLEMLMSGRPSLQSLCELKIWRPKSISFEVSVSRAELEDDPTGLTIAGSSMQQVVVYYVSVVCKDSFPELSGSDKIPNPSSWVIRKRYSDFDDLHKQIKLYVSNRVMTHLPLPLKQYINVGGMGSGSSAFVEKRRQRLQDYMDCVLRFLSCCEEVQKFLSCDSFLNPDSDLETQIGINSRSANPTEHRMRQSMLDEIRSGKPKFAESERSHDTAAIDNIFPVALEKTTNKEIPLSRSETNGNDDDFFVRGVASAGLDSRTMRVLEARVYDLIKEVLDVDSMNVVRRNFVSLLRQSVRLFFSTTLKQWASAQAKESVSDANLTWLLDYLLQTVWPNGTLVQANPIAMDIKAEAAELQKLRKSNAVELMSRLPAGLLSNSLGDGQIDKAVDKIFDLVDNAYLLKSLVFVLIDMLLIEIFPELRPFLSGMDTLRQE